MLRRQRSRIDVRRLSRKRRKKVFNELCELVAETIELYRKDGKSLPPPTSGRDFATKMQNVA